MPEPRFSEPDTFDEASGLVFEPAKNVIPMAGGTWIMRSKFRRETFADHYVSLEKIPELHAIQRHPDGSLHVGAMVTHSQLAAATKGISELRGLHTAAAKSANPNIRNVATVGGNICASGFSEADLVPALMSLNSEVVFTRWNGEHRMLLTDFMATPGTGRYVLRKVVVPPSVCYSAHVRLPLRAAGDYPVAIVSGALKLKSGTVTQASISLGSVEKVARRWVSLEDALAGNPADPSAAEEMARISLHELEARSCLGTSSQYRLAVTPILVKRFIEECLFATHHLDKAELSI